MYVPHLYHLPASTADAPLQTNAVTYQTGQDTVVRAQFLKNGTLANSQDTNFRAVSDDWPVFGLAQDLGTVSGTSQTVVYAIGHVRDPAVQYIVANNGLQLRSMYFWSKFSSVTDLVSPPRFRTRGKVGC